MQYWTGVSYSLSYTHTRSLSPLFIPFICLECAEILISIVFHCIINHSSRARPNKSFIHHTQNMKCMLQMLENLYLFDVYRVVCVCVCVIFTNSVRILSFFTSFDWFCVHSFEFNEPRAQQNNVFWIMAVWAKSIKLYWIRVIFIEGFFFQCKLWKWCRMLLLVYMMFRNETYFSTHSKQELWVFIPA